MKNCCVRPLNDRFKLKTSLIISYVKSCGRLYSCLVAVFCLVSSVRHMWCDNRPTCVCVCSLSFRFQLAQFRIWFRRKCATFEQPNCLTSERTRACEKDTVDMPTCTHTTMFVCRLHPFAVDTNCTCIREQRIIADTRCRIHSHRYTQQCWPKQRYHSVWDS